MRYIARSGGDQLGQVAAALLHSERKPVVKAMKPTDHAMSRVAVAVVPEVGTTSGKATGLRHQIAGVSCRVSNDDVDRIRRNLCRVILGEAECGQPVLVSRSIDNTDSHLRRVADQRRGSQRAAIVDQTHADVAGHHPTEALAADRHGRIRAICRE